jgi:hypothetical protein
VPDIGEYCRQVEDCLTRANGGHLVRIVGPGFELVRGWALDGIPLSIVCRGIEAKAERHDRGGGAKRPLRIEFCEADVRAIFDHWRRAVGVASLTEHQPGAEGEADQASPSKRPSLSRHIDRARESLIRAAGRLDLPELLRDGIGGLIDEMTALAPTARRARGEARDVVVARLAELDRELADRARAAAAPELAAQIQEEAGRDLAPFRARLDPGAWQRALDVTADRLIRRRFGLPNLEAR